MIVVHLRQHIDGIRVELQMWTIHNAESIQLVAQRNLPEDKLCSVRTIETVYTIGSADSVLDKDSRTVRAIARIKSEDELWD